MGCCLKKEKPGNQTPKPSSATNFPPSSAELNTQNHLGVDHEAQPNRQNREAGRPAAQRPNSNISPGEPAVRMLAPTITAHPIQLRPDHEVQPMPFAVGTSPIMVQPSFTPMAWEAAAHEPIIDPAQITPAALVRKSVVPPAPTGSKRPFSLKEILEVLNLVREHPQKYADAIQTKYIDQLDTLKTKDMQPQEGLPVFEEAKRFLQHSPSMPPLTLDCGLTAAAYLHSCFMSETNNLDHTGRGGSDAGDRIDKFGRIEGLGEMGNAENILKAPEFDPLHFILRFVIDDGVSSRAHRENLFLPGIRKVGLGVKEPPSKHKHWYFTMDFAYETYKGQKSMIPANVMEESGLNDYSRATGITF